MAGGLIVSFYAVWKKDIVVFEANIYMNEIYFVKWYLPET